MEQDSGSGEGDLMLGMELICAIIWLQRVFLRVMASSASESGDGGGVNNSVLSCFLIEPRRVDRFVAMSAEEEDGGGVGLFRMEIG